MKIILKAVATAAFLAAAVLVIVANYMERID